MSDGITLNFPLFKFLEKKWADEMRINGSIKLSYISEFRNDIFCGKIHDKDEGFLNIQNFYSEYSGLAKDANGLIKFLFPPECNVNFKKQKIKQTINIFDLLIYCTSRHLFSESLNQAFEDGKDSCIMISNPDEFFKEISEEIKEYTFFRNDLCDYSIGKCINESDPELNSLTNRFLSNSPAIAFIKPPKFVNQMEYRAVWVPKNYPSSLNPIFPNIKKLTEYCFPIDISNVDHKKLFEYNSDVEICCKIIGKNGSASLSRYSNRHKIPCPVIVNHPEYKNPLVGLFSPSHVIRNAIISNAVIGLLQTEKGNIHNLFFSKI